jgi:hypothetical protein
MGIHFFERPIRNSDEYVSEGLAAACFGDPRQREGEISARRTYVYPERGT